MLIETKQPGLKELRCYLADMYATDCVKGRIVTVTKLLRSRVFRVIVELDGVKHSLVIKRLSPDLAYLERRVIERWLPRLKMDRYGPPLIGSVAEKSGKCVWHVYEDLGSWTLDKHLEDTASVLKATHLIADLHRRSSLHPLLAECRTSGCDFGICF